MMLYQPRQYAAEFLGTFLLTFAISTSLTLDFPVPTIFVAALTIAALAYALGPVSGGYFNPAVTVGLFSIGKIAFRDALMYVVFQLLGGFLAVLLLTGMQTTHALIVKDTLPAIIGELIGAFVLTFGVSAVVFNRVHEAAMGIIVGLSLFVGITIAASGSLAIVNPAVALGLGAFSLVYLIVPIVGGIFGSYAYRWFRG